MYDFDNIYLKNVCSFQEGYVNPSQKFPEYFDGDIKWIRVNDLNNSFVYDTTRKLSEIGFKSAGKSALLFEPDSIVISKSGTIGKLGIIKDYMCGNRAVINIKVNKSTTNYKYIFYYLRSIQKEIETMAVGSVQPNLYTSILGEIPITIPSLPVQERIAEVLSSLDDKIDLLQRQNKTLEEMAETLFRQWFVEEAEKVEEDFKVTKIKDLDIFITDFVSNGSFESLKNNVTLIPDKKDFALFIRNTDLKSGFKNKVYVDENSYNFLSKSKLYGGEIIISNVADVGSVHICPQFEIPMTLGNNVIMLKSKYNLFLYYYFKSQIGQSQIQGITSGSAQQKFNKTDFRSLEINISKEEDLIKFHNAVLDFHRKKDNNSLQIQQLETLRDTLLPKLMSGTVRVNN
jgi:type I restriction enzyme S subunit